MMLLRMRISWPMRRACVIALMRNEYIMMDHRLALLVVLVGLSDEGRGVLHGTGCIGAWRR